MRKLTFLLVILLTLTAYPQHIDWLKAYDGPFGIASPQLVQGPGDTIFGAGHLNNTWLFDTIPSKGIDGDKDAILFCWNDSGELLWLRRFNQGCVSGISSIKTEKAIYDPAAEQVVITGSINCNWNNLATSTKLFIRSYGLSGDLRWHRELTPSEQDPSYPYDLLLSSNSELIISGLRTTDPLSTPGWDPLIPAGNFIVRLSSAGEILFADPFMTNGRVEKMLHGSNGSLFIGGHTSPGATLLGGPFPTQYPDEVFVAHMEMSGMVHWRSTFRSTGTCKMVGISAGSDHIAALIRYTGDLLEPVDTISTSGAHINRYALAMFDLQGVLQHVSSILSSRPITSTKSFPTNYIYKLAQCK